MSAPSQQELQEAGLLNDDVAPRVKRLINLMQESGRWYVPISTLQIMDRYRTPTPPSEPETVPAVAPEILYRSDMQEGPYFSLVTSVRGVADAAFRAIWHTTAPEISATLSARQIRWTALHAIQYETQDQTPSPIVIWLFVAPGSTSVNQARLASIEVLAGLEAKGFQGIIIEWGEGTVEQLAG